MSKALIITPTGCPMFFDDEFDKDNHWRMCKPEANYDVCVVNFRDGEFEPEQGSYDFYIPMKGRKWNLLPKIIDRINEEKLFDLDKYSIIGFWDDDYCTDIQSVNLALDLARRYDMRLFQQSLTSWTVYPILEHNPKYLFTETNFIELGVPFFRKDIFYKVVDFLRDYQYIESDWGIDKVLCYYLQTTACVIHASKVKHMRRESSYSKEAGFREMEYLMTNFFPKYMKEKFNIEYKPIDIQFVIKEYVHEDGE